MVEVTYVVTDAGGSRLVTFQAEDEEQLEKAVNKYERHLDADAVMDECAVYSNFDIDP